MLKFIKYLFDIRSKLLLFDQTMKANEELIKEKEQLIRDNYRLSHNLTNNLQRNLELVEELVHYRTAEPDKPLDLNEELNPEDLATIDRLAQQFKPIHQVISQSNNN